MRLPFTTSVDPHLCEWESYCVVHANAKNRIMGGGVKKLKTRRWRLIWITCRKSAVLVTWRRSRVGIPAPNFW